MARAPLNTADVKIEQAPPIENPQDRLNQIVAGDETILEDKDHAERLAMGEDAVTIMINPSNEENAPTSYPVWVNGKGGEVFLNGQWLPMTYLPVGVELITKRKYVEVLARAKTDNIRTVHDSANVERPRNTVQRTTSAVANFTVLEDKNPRGPAWFAELRRRNH